jgi:hypothetical protein
VYSQKHVYAQNDDRTWIKGWLMQLLQKIPPTGALKDFSGLLWEKDFSGLLWEKKVRCTHSPCLFFKLAQTRLCPLNEMQNAHLMGFQEAQSNEIDETCDDI